MNGEGINLERRRPRRRIHTMPCRAITRPLGACALLALARLVSGGAVGAVLGLNACDETRIEQVWFFNGSISAYPQLYMYMNVPYAGNGPWCATINEDASATGDNATVWTAACTTLPATNSFWNISGAGIQSENAGARCLAVFPGQPLAAGSRVTTAVCNASDPMQAFSYDESSGLVVLSPAGGPTNLCVDAAAPEAYCALPPQSTWPFCNPMLGLAERAADIVGRLTLADKIQALATETPYLPSVKVGVHAHRRCDVTPTVTLSHSLTSAQPVPPPRSSPRTTGARRRATGSRASATTSRRPMRATRRYPSRRAPRSTGGGRTAGCPLTEG